MWLNGRMKCQRPCQVIRTLQQPWRQLLGNDDETQTGTRTLDLVSKLLILQPSCAQLVLKGLVSILS